MIFGHFSEFEHISEQSSNNKYSLKILQNIQFIPHKLYIFIL